MPVGEVNNMLSIRASGLFSKEGKCFKRWSVSLELVKLAVIGFARWKLAR
jgi:hypothetical protein